MKAIDRIFEIIFKKRIIIFIDNNLDFLYKHHLQEKLLRQYLVFGNEKHLSIAPTAVVNNALFNLSSGRITIEEYAFFGHYVSLITGTHDYNKFGLERQQAIPSSGRDILIKQGVWISSNSTILGPCIIGENSVVASCSLVTADVEPYTLVAGIPARKIRTIRR